MVSSMNWDPDRLVILGQNLLDKLVQGCWRSADRNPICGNSANVGLGRRRNKLLLLVTLFSFLRFISKELTCWLENASMFSRASLSLIPETNADQLVEEELPASTNFRTEWTQRPSRRARTTVWTATGTNSPAVLEELTAAEASRPVQRPTITESSVDGYAWPRSP